MKKALFVLSTALLSMGVASAQGNGTTGSVTITVGNSGSVGTLGTAGNVNATPLLQLLSAAQEIVSRLVPFIIGLAVLAFFWFLVQFIFNPGDGEERTKKLHGMGYAVLALFLMVSIWGIINLLGNVFGIGQGGNIPVPTVPKPVIPTTTN